jgi:hypothetical protein
MAGMDAFCRRCGFEWLDAADPWIGETKPIELDVG